MPSKQEFHLEQYSIFKLKPIEKLEMAFEIVRTMDPKIRPLSSDKKPGGLVEFSVNDEREFIIMETYTQIRTTLNEYLWIR
jgi:hypothetical protein